MVKISYRNTITENVAEIALTQMVEELHPIPEKCSLNPNLP